jgi:hypothetical protein
MGRARRHAPAVAEGRQDFGGWNSGATVSKQGIVVPVYVQLAKIAPSASSVEGAI